jgi:hypothetical protein
MLKFMRKPFGIIDRFVDRIGYWYGAYGMFAGGSVMGLTAGWIASYSTWMEKFGAIGWFMTGLMAFLLFSLAALCIASVRHRWIAASAARRWSEKVDTFNPLDRDFQRKRLKFHDLASPMGRRITGKRIRDCELIGPANVFIYRDIELQSNNFVDCIFVVLWPDAKGMLLTGDAVILEATKIDDSVIFGATIMIPPQLVPTFREMGVTFATLSGDQEHDIQLPTNIQVGTPH